MPQLSATKDGRGLTGSPPPSPPHVQELCNQSSNPFIWGWKSDCRVVARVAGKVEGRAVDKCTFVFKSRLPILFHAQPPHKTHHTSCYFPLTHMQVQTTQCATPCFCRTSHFFPNHSCTPHPPKQQDTPLLCRPQWVSACSQGHPCCVESCNTQHSTAHIIA